MEAYFELRRRALSMLLEHVDYSKTGKAHLKLRRENRRRLRSELLEDWDYAKHYVDSALNSVIWLVKSWIKLYNKRKARIMPSITKKTVYIKTTLFKVKDGKLRITVKPRRYIEVDLSRYSYLPRDYDSIGGLVLRENKLIITFKRKIELKKPRGYASFDVNLTNVTAFINGATARYDLRPLYHVHRVYEEKRRRIQMLIKTKPKTARRLLEKYSRRERNRARGIMHKLTTSITRQLTTLSYGAILEDLKGIKERKLKRNRSLNRKISKWNARIFQSMLEYKLKWNGLPVKYVNPENTSKTCPLCSGRLTAYEGRILKCPKCGLTGDRDVIAALNLQMQGFPPSPSTFHRVVTRKMIYSRRMQMRRGRGVTPRGCEADDNPRLMHTKACIGLKTYAS